MKKNILSEINRLKEIMGLEIINEQIDVEDEVIDEPTQEFPYVKWNSKGLTVYTEKEFENKNIGGPVAGIRYIGPFGNQGYTTLQPKGVVKFDGERIRLYEPGGMLVGGNMDIPFLEIDNIKSDTTGQNSYYDLGEGSRFVGNQAESWKYQRSELYDNIGEDLGTYGIQQTKGQFRMLVYGNKTKQKLAIGVVSIQLKKIDELKAMGKAEGETSKKKGYLSMNNYVKKPRTSYAWHLSGDLRLLPTAGIEEWTPKPPPDTITQDFTFNVEDPFEFDKPDITPEAKKAIKRELSRLYDLNDEGLLDQYIKYKINGKQIVVNAYSSIDAKSDELGGGGVKECNPGKVTRAKYNLCLSQKRAETIVNHLNTDYSDIFGEANLIAKGMGELESPNSVNEPYHLKATAEHIKKYPELKLILGQSFRNPPQLKHSNENRVTTAADRKFVVNLPGAKFKDGKIQ